MLQAMRFRIKKCTLYLNIAADSCKHRCMYMVKVHGPLGFNSLLDYYQNLIMVWL